ncbi:hypothetical protein [Actinomadura litoris]|uniref:hypothetical protein n=1 Tax=Actinomadura litoris TaxID=2678616 RepID=UPI001FA7776F|nr:hypothetical protein [Actinomadura litoris]
MLVYEPGRISAAPPEERSVKNADEAAALVEELASSGIRAEPVSRTVTAWEPDCDAQRALFLMRMGLVRQVVGELVEGERTVQGAAGNIARLTPDMGPVVRRYWVGELAALLALDIPDSPQWVTDRICHALEVLSGHVPPGPAGN